MLHPPLVIEIWSLKSRFPLSSFSRFRCATLINISLHTPRVTSFRKTLNSYISFHRTHVTYEVLPFAKTQLILDSIVPPFLWFKNSNHLRCYKRYKLNQTLQFSSLELSTPISLFTPFTSVSQRESFVL